ncbi:metallophosphoesterase [Pseudomonas sp. Lz4W]|uniref:metallophosphoesterase n=1 Tax=Pseudomonas sp. Lz4W TaxID=1206777 RepID=UPI0002BF4993|nr:metallophosphoesterase [Pseudomonas sp. Lz4W]AUB75137.1 metallophosphoesterase [Pseudomonas sp. Lz4W]NBF17915.1 metallophosphoesterase [Pseudomonas sp. Fl4BN2]
MFHFITAIIALYVIWRFVRPLSVGRAGKIGLGVLLLLIAEHHLVTRTFFGSMASPEVPGQVLVVLGWAFASLILLALLLLIRDLLGIVVWALRGRTGRVLLGGSRLGIALGLISTGLSAVGVWQAIRVPDVKTMEIVLPRLPAELDGLRIVQLTDLHASRLLQAPWLQAVVDKTNALKPDLILITGDLVDGSPRARVDDVQPLKDLRARYGVFAIPGNHEYYVDYVHWLPAFEHLGLHMLLNEHVLITHNGRDLVLAGVTDKAAQPFKLPEPDIIKALKGAPAGDPVILLSHRPGGALLNAGQGVDLQLSGHTHGGQILGPHLIAKWANEGFVSGLYAVAGMQLYVSNGTGLWNGFPVRLGRPSEITEIVLRAPKVQPE